MESRQSARRDTLIGAIDLSRRKCPDRSGNQYSPETSWYHDKMMGWHPTQRNFVHTASHPGVKPLDPSGRNIEPDDVLLHELVHAARAVQGLLCGSLMNQMTDSRQGQVDKVEEY